MKKKFRLSIVDIIIVVLFSIIIYFFYIDLKDSRKLSKELETTEIKDTTTNILFEDIWGTSLVTSEEDL